MADQDDEGPDLKAGVAEAELAEGAMLAGQVDGEAVLLARSGGKLFAVGAQCTHFGAPLAKGLLVDGEVRCPWHHARFALETGEAVGAPAFGPLACYRVKAEQGRIVVEGKAATAEPPTPPKSPSRVLIVGGGAAGFACAEMLGRHGCGGAVTLVSTDPNAPYDRTDCSKAYLSGENARDQLELKGPGFEGGAGPTVRLNTTIAALDLAAGAAVTADGERIGYDALVLATGAEPNRPDLPGFERANVFTLRSLEDADALVAAAGAAMRGAVVGASFIGLEAAASLIARKLEVTVVAPEAVPLANVMGEAVGRYVQGLHEAKGVVFRLGRKGQGYDGHALTLDDGSTVEADFVVLGVGVKPRLALAEAAGLRMASKAEGGGVEVDARLQTSASGVYAVGDIANYPDPRHEGGRLRVEHWVVAGRQGQHVARVLLGLADAYAETPFFWSGHYENSLRYVGHAGRADDTEVQGRVAEGDFLVRYREGGEARAATACQRDVTALEIEAAWDG